MTGIKVVFGVREPKPITGAPEGRQKLLLRPLSVGKLLVRTATGVRMFYLQDNGDTWHCFSEIAMNDRPPSVYRR